MDNLSQNALNIENRLKVILENYKNEYLKFGITKDNIQDTINKAQNLSSIYNHRSHNAVSKGKQQLRKQYVDLIFHSVNIIKLYYKLDFTKGSVEYKYGSSSNFHGLSGNKFEDKCMQFHRYTLDLIEQFKQKELVQTELDNILQNLSIFKAANDALSKIKAERMVAKRNEMKIRTEIYEETRNYLQVGKIIYTDSSQNTVFKMTNLLYPRKRKRKTNTSEAEVERDENCME